MISEGDLPNMFVYSWGLDSAPHYHHDTPLYLPLKSSVLKIRDWSWFQKP